jgi:ribosomal protein S8
MILYCKFPPLQHAPICAISGTKLVQIRSKFIFSTTTKNANIKLFELSKYLLIGYINEFEVIDDKRNGKIVIELNGRINKCGVISPRFNIKLVNFEKTLYQILPSRQFGFVVLSTNHGIMDHLEARKRHLGGRIIGFFY